MVLGNGWSGAKQEPAHLIWQNFFGHTERHGNNIIVQTMFKTRVVCCENVYVLYLQCWQMGAAWCGVYSAVRTLPYNIRCIIRTHNRNLCFAIYIYIWMSQSFSLAIYYITVYVTAAAVAVHLRCRSTIFGNLYHFLSLYPIFVAAINVKQPNVTLILMLSECGKILPIF